MAANEMIAAVLQILRRQELAEEGLTLQQSACSNAAG